MTLELQPISFKEACEFINKYHRHHIAPLTYTLKSEPGTSLKAAGFKVLYQCKGGSWNRKGRPRIDKHPIGQKTVWGIIEQKRNM